MGKATKRKAESEADLADLEVALKAIELEEKLAEQAPTIGRPFRYIFTKPVDDHSVKKALRQLDDWHHADSEAPIDFVVNTVGGSVKAGMHLFDELVALSESGGGTHQVRTIIRGEACSMGAILSQAGDIRVMGARSLMMVHGASNGLYGNAGDHRDNLDCLNRITEQMIQLFTGRSGGKCSRDHFLYNTERRDWWLTANECLALGFIDQIG